MVKRWLVDVTYCKGILLFTCNRTQSTFIPNCEGWLSGCTSSSLISQYSLYSTLFHGDSYIYYYYYGQLVLGLTYKFSGDIQWYIIHFEDFLGVIFLGIACPHEIWGGKLSGLYFTIFSDQPFPRRKVCINLRSCCANFPSQRASLRHHIAQSSSVGPMYPHPNKQ